MREETGEKHGKLRIAESADDTLARRNRRAEPLRGATAEDRKVRSVRSRHTEEHLGGEENEVGGTRELEHDERRFRRQEEGGKTGAGRDRPGRLTGDDAESREDACFTAIAKGVADREGGILPRRADHKNGNAEERREFGDHADGLSGRAQCGGPHGSRQREQRLWHT